MAATYNRDGRLSDNSVRIIRQQSLFDGQVSRDDVAALCNEVTRLRTLERKVTQFWATWGETEGEDLDQMTLWEDLGALLSVTPDTQVPGVV